MLHDILMFLLYQIQKQPQFVHDSFCIYYFTKTWLNTNWADCVLLSQAM